ncbi:putative membrane protein [Yoonia maritima]|uniref:Putative membrane protein n=1 Tax=Yoonia maritima TaxID=1435347 RepID=A0A2T0VTI8_9RHOB|nr:DUF2254 domain-containing protein [Yoonia maritima]PRY74343.1 putative membrane protein [Yoonia maritima]
MSVSARVTKIIDDVRASYWFIPAVLVVCAMIVAQASIVVDRNPDIALFKLNFLATSVSVDGARAVLSVISQSVIGVAGVMFSITMVAVTFASGQYGPRLIGNFMRDRGNQWSLGILISTFTYSLLILRAVQSPQGIDVDMFVPQVSIFIALSLALVSVFTVIYHVHHVPETISVSNIIAALGKRLIADLQGMASARPIAEAATEDDQQYVDISMHTAGYVHAIAAVRLAELSADRGWTVQVLAEPGAFVHSEVPMLRIWGIGELSDEDRSDLRQCVALGHSKTEDQNVLFVVEQLVEIVGRAMSPGINDPFTAISCMQWLEAGVSVVAKHNGDLRIIDEDAVIAARISFHRLLEQSLGNCVPYVCGDVLARAELERLLEQLCRNSSDENKPIVRELISKTRSY